MKERPEPNSEPVSNGRAGEIYNNHGFFVGRFGCMNVLYYKEIHKKLISKIFIIRSSVKYFFMKIILYYVSLQRSSGLLGRFTSVANLTMTHVTPSTLGSKMPIKSTARVIGGARVLGELGSERPLGEGINVGCLDNLSTGRTPPWQLLRWSLTVKLRAGLAQTTVHLGNKLPFER